MQVLSSGCGMPYVQYDNERLTLQVSFDIQKEKIQKFIDKEIPKFLKNLDSYAVGIERPTKARLVYGDNEINGKSLFSNYQTLQEAYFESRIKSANSMPAPKPYVMGKNKPVK